MELWSDSPFPRPWQGIKGNFTRRTVQLFSLFHFMGGCNHKANDSSNWVFHTCFEVGRALPLTTLASPHFKQTEYITVLGTIHPPYCHNVHQKPAMNHPHQPTYKQISVMNQKDTAIYGKTAASFLVG